MAFVLVLIFSPRLNGARIIHGIRFITKTGAPGLTDLGLVLLVVVPIVTFFVMYSLIWWLKGRQKLEDEKLIS